MNLTPESTPGWKTGHIIHKWPHLSVRMSFPQHTSSLCSWILHDSSLPRGPYSAVSIAKATGCIMVFLAKNEFLLGCLIKCQIMYIQNWTTVLSPQSIPLKAVLFSIDASFILLVVQTRKLGVIHDSFISLRLIHQKIFLASPSKYI